MSSQSVVVVFDRRCVIDSKNASDDGARDPSQADDEDNLEGFNGQQRPPFGQSEREQEFVYWFQHSDIRDYRRRELLGSIATFRTCN